MAPWLNCSVVLHENIQLIVSQRKHIHFQIHGQIPVKYQLMALLSANVFKQPGFSSSSQTAFREPHFPAVLICYESGRPGGHQQPTKPARQGIDSTVWTYTSRQYWDGWVSLASLASRAWEMPVDGQQPKMSGRTWFPQDCLEHTAT